MMGRRGLVELGLKGGFPMERRSSNVLLAVSAVLMAIGFCVAIGSTGFFMNLLGAAFAAIGGAAVYLNLAERTERKRRARNGF
ncbi:hypothetical protein XI09_16870 [Bradyrhizobium sp. CCBAU 11386]|uniref:hypothetical protein n=1 Tax=Bradyrhizobium sp. CCBAU 11386 TaxID=1630837 RepID=UPI0023027915|nr:hypothetical protein [Bradyrhizobium sp. CCBAU 11386]MDA9506276.1 hypothetical protein [Bradyrhizobium sp. CCBAU 11386]